MGAYVESGFSVREPMWWCGYDHTIEEYPGSWDEARKIVGLDWEPVLRPLAYNRAPNPDNEMWTPLGSKFQGVVRPDTGALLSVVSGDFSLILHEEMGQILEAILGETNVRYETLLVMKGGAVIAALVRLDEPYRVAGDDTETWPFLAFVNFHNGTGAAKVILTQVRVVCWNTTQMAMAEGERTGRQFSFRHVGNPMEHIEEARAAIQGLRDESKEWQELAAELFGMKVEEAHLNHFLSEFIPEPPADIVSPRVRNNIERARGVFKHLYLESVTCQAHTGTALGLMDAATEYLDHVRDYRTPDSYVGRTILRPEPLKAKALAIVRRVVK